MPKHYSNGPTGRHFPNVPDPADVPDLAKTPDPADVPDPAAEPDPATQEQTRPATPLQEGTGVVGDETTVLSPDRRGHKLGKANEATSGEGKDTSPDAPADSGATVALTPEQAKEAAQAASEPTNDIRSAARHPAHAADGDKRTSPATGAPDVDDASGNLFAPLGKRDVATVQPDSPSYRAKPSPYLSRRQAARDPEKTKKHHSVAIGVTLAVAAAVAVGGGAYYVHQQMSSQVQTTNTQFETARITRGEFLDTIDGTTTLQPIDSSDVTSEVTGTIKDLKVQDGTQVSRGDTLFTLDNPTITAATETAKDQRDQAQTEVDEKARQVQDAQDKLDEANNTIRDSLSKIYAIAGKTPGATSFNVDTDGDGIPDALDTNGDGKADAFDTNGDGIVDMIDTNGDGTPDTVDTNGDGKVDSASDLPSTLTDEQRTELAAAETALVSARAQASSYQTTVDTGNAALKTAQDSLSSLQSAYDKALAQEKKLVVTAPISGTVHNLSSSLTEGGSIATAGKVCQIDDMSSLTLTIQASESKVRRAKAGQEARLTFPDISDLNLTTTVDSVASEKTEGTDTYAVNMTIEDPDDRLQVGTTVNASVVLQQIEDVLVVPAAAIQTRGQDSYVDVLLDPVRGIETLVQVNVTASNEDNAVIEGESIQEGNAVVLSKTEGDGNSNANAS